MIHKTLETSLGKNPVNGWILYETNTLPTDQAPFFHVLTLEPSYKHFNVLSFCINSKYPENTKILILS